jgi:hypothetical protein
MPDLATSPHVGEPEAAVNMAAHGHEHLPLRLHLAG